MEGYISAEEQLKDYINLFFLLTEPGPQEELRERFGAERKRIIRKEEEGDTPLPCCWLRDRGMLTETEYLLMMLAAAFELESSLCMDFRKQSGREWPDYRYAFKLLSGVTDIGFDLILKLLNREGALNLVFLLEGGEGEGGVLSKPLMLRETVLGFILTGDLVWREWYTLWRGDGQSEFLRINERELELLGKAIRSGRGMTLSLTGRKGSGKHSLIRRCCAAEKETACFVRLDQIERREYGEKEGIYSELQLLRLLLHPILVVEAGEVKGEALKKALEELFLKLFCGEEPGDLPGNRILLLCENRESEETANCFSDFNITMGEALSAEEKREVLDHYIGREERPLWQEELFLDCRVNIGELIERLKRAEIYAELHQGEADREELYKRAAQRPHWTHPFGRFIESGYDLEDLILPEECLRQLKLFLAMGKGWLRGRGGQQEPGKGQKGLQVLFHGSSGTGKTMAASVMAARLGLALFKVDLSRLADKYIGETEKHIDEIFETARRENCIVFFDEADAVFAKRTEIQDSNDRYSNMSVAYLLQRMEDFDGIVILATNLLKNFDEAFLRRIGFVIKFRELEEQDRLRLWKRVLGEAMPVAEDVRPEVLAKAVNFSPARIRASVRTACMLADSENSSRLENRHIMDSLYLEAGKDETAVGMLGRIYNRE